jgi:methionine-gamma-lyase
MKFQSYCVKENKDTKTTKPHTLPIYATSSFEFDNINEGIDIFKGVTQGHVYSRYGNPTVETVAMKIATMESFESENEYHAVLTSSGMSAISTLVCGLLTHGDKILTQGNLYGGSTELFQKVFSNLGIQVIFTDLKNLDQVEDILKKEKAIKMLYFESPSNPTLACIDIKAIASLCKNHKIISAVDNTFCTPYLQRPLNMGIDYAIHSTTKFLNGHGNSIAGAIVGKSELNKGKIWQTMKLMGTNCNPWDAWLINNGLKTLALRMDKHGENAMSLAIFLEKHPKVNRVNYNGLASHKDHELAKSQMSGYGGMLSFEVKGGLDAAIKVIDTTKFCSLAPTLGDVDTLVLHPATSSHLNIPKEMREENDITDGLIRVSVGIEHSDDIIADFGQALDVL